MKCREAQDLILTDHADSQGWPWKRAELETHLRNCGPCREFETRVKEFVLDPLRGVERVQPPDSVWRKIRLKIGQEQKQAVNPLGRHVLGIRWPFRAPRPSFVATMVAVVLLIMVTWVGVADRARRTSGGLEDEMDSVVYWVNGSNTVLNGEGEGFGTVIEEYYL